jgi:hypothetical protein
MSMVTLRKSGGGGSGTGPYTELMILTFTHDSGVQEKGMTVTDTNLSWTYNTPTYPVTNQEINQGVGVIPVGTLTIALSGLSITSDFTWRLTATNTVETPTADTTIYFRNKRYWGPDAKTSLGSADILTLPSSEFATNRLTTKVFDCSGGNYIWLCYPTSWGVGEFWVGGFLTTFIQNIVSHTNASGHTENYYTYRSLYIQYGSNIQVEVR